MVIGFTRCYRYRQPIEIGILLQQRTIAQRYVRRESSVSETQDRVSFYTIKDLPSFSPVEGISMQAIVGEKMMANWVWLEPGVVMPEHEHPHEQVGAVLQGALELTTPEGGQVVNPGEAYIVPSGVRHKGVAGPEGCLVLDIFSPPREEYAEMAKGQNPDDA